jgi:hypothetical protein
MAPLFHYTLHGRLFASDSELPLLSRADAGDPQLTLRLASHTSGEPRRGAAWYRSEPTSGDEAIVIDRTEDGELLVHFPDATSFRVAQDGASIELLAAPARYTRDDVAAYALGPVLAIALHLQGAVLLHAASVVMHGKALLFAGASGAGKSTTAAIFHHLGYDVLADDLTEIDGAFALPSIAAVRLWPDVLESLYGSAAAFPDRAPSWDKKVVCVETVERPHEIAAILFLDGAAANPQIERLAPKEGWLRLIANAYTARLPDPEMSHRIFDETSALADRVPMFSFAPPLLATPEALPAFVERALAEWLR